MAQLLAGLGTELPASTRFVIAVSHSFIWPVGMLLALFVIGKELLLRDFILKKIG
jgi:type II secretory pathway component PulF